MIWLIDTNVVLDVLTDREPFVQDAAHVLKLCEAGLARGVMCAQSFPNIVYILRKRLSPEQTEATLRMLELIVSVEDLKAADLRRAARLGWPDFEDALQFAVADRIGADAIVTRNPADFRGSSISVKTPAEIVREM